MGLQHEERRDAVSHARDAGPSFARPIRGISIVHGDVMPIDSSGNDDLPSVWDIDLESMPKEEYMMADEYESRPLVLDDTAKAAQYEAAMEWLDARLIWREAASGKTLSLVGRLVLLAEKASTRSLPDA